MGLENRIVASFWAFGCGNGIITRRLSLLSNRISSCEPRRVMLTSSSELLSKDHPSGAINSIGI